MTLVIANTMVFEKLNGFNFHLYFLVISVFGKTQTLNFIQSSPDFGEAVDHVGKKLSKDF